MPAEGRDVSPQSEPDHEEYRLCLLCRAGNFTEEPPLSGECRRSPPRSYLDGGRPGRFFPMVRFDDWCGQYSRIRDKEKIAAQVAAVAPFRSKAARADMADKLYKDGHHSEARVIYESLYDDSAHQGEIA